MRALLSDDFRILGSCAGRPHGWRRRLADFLCRHTGHLLWRNHNNAGYQPEDHSLNHYTTVCRRCWQWGYVDGDFKPDERKRTIELITDVMKRQRSMAPGPAQKVRR